MLRVQFVATERGAETPQWAVHVRVVWWKAGATGPCTQF